MLGYLYGRVRVDCSANLRKPYHVTPVIVINAKKFLAPNFRYYYIPNLNYLFCAGVEKLGKGYQTKGAFL